VRAIARRILEKNGYRVLAAASVPEAVRLCETEAAGIDLLLTDVIMPGSTGPELAARLLALLPSLRVVLHVWLHGRQRDCSRHHRRHSNFIQKPFTGELLARKVRTALDEPRS